MTDPSGRVDSAPIQRPDRPLRRSSRQILQSGVAGDLKSQIRRHCLGASTILDLRDIGQSAEIIVLGHEGLAVKHHRAARGQPNSLTRQHQFQRDEGKRVGLLPLGDQQGIHQPRSRIENESPGT